MQLVEQGTVRLTDPVAVLGAGVRTLRQGRDHGAPSADPRVGAAARRRSRRAVEGLRGGHRPGGERGADGAARRAVRLQRHQLLPARPHRGPGLERAARAVRDAPRVRAARHDRHRVPAAARAGRPHRADRTLPVPRRVAVQGTRVRTAARRGARPDRAAHGRRRRPRRAVQHGPRPDAVRADAARRRRARAAARAGAADRRQDDHPGDAGRDARRSAASAGTSTPASRPTAAS